MASQLSGSSFHSTGDHYNSETAGAFGWSLRTWQLDDNLGLRAEDFAPRSDAPRDSGLLERVRPRQDVRLVCPALRRLPRNPEEETTQASKTRFAPRYASTLQNCQSRAPHLQAQLRERQAQASVTPL